MTTLLGVDAVTFVGTVEELSVGSVSFYDLAEHFSSRPHFALLDSQCSHDSVGPFSFFSFAPFAKLKTKGSIGTLQIAGRERHCSTDVFDVVDCLLECHRLEDPDKVWPVPFLGGAIGYLAYELGHQIEVLPARSVDDLRLPDCYLCLYNFAVVLHHRSGTMFLCHLKSLGPQIGLSKEFLKTELGTVAPGTYHRKSYEQEGPPTPEIFAPTLVKASYMEAVSRVKDYIVAGDVYQVNVTQRFSAEIGEISPWELYKHLADINPAPFAAYLNFDGHAIVSSSPERFIRLKQRHVETMPIKGTIKRGDTSDEDAANQLLLFHSGKNRAELAMIVDLLRNDLGRVCTPGSVTVNVFPELVSYASVHHLVATITGELASDQRIKDLLRATFPGGSITGAPKIRAMEIIDELEPVCRGVYTGSIGYFGFDNSVDLNIAIRTLIVMDGRAFVHAGGGVVADSVEREEYDECLLKAAKLLQAVRTVCSAQRSIAGLQCVGHELSSRVLTERSLE